MPSVRNRNSISRRAFQQGSLTSILLLAIIANTPSIAAKIDLGEIRDDTAPESNEEIIWPEHEFPDPKQSGSKFKAGERFQFHGQWGILRKAAQLTISTESAASEDATLLLVKTNMRTTGLAKALFPIQLEGRTLLQSQKGRILNNRVNETNRSTETNVETTFDYETGLMSLVDKSRPERNATKDFPYPVPLDYASAFLQIRGWDLSENSRHSFLISAKGKFYLIEMQTMKVETISTKYGKMDAFRIEPISALPQSKLFREGGKMAVWISADERRLPLRIDFKISIGTASIRLDDFTLSDEALVAQQ
jgi:hypothetical protein